jgi:glycosidase
MSGEYEELETNNPDVFGFRRTNGSQTVILFLNFSKSSKTEEGFSEESLLFMSNGVAANFKAGRVTLAPYSGVVLSAGR